MLFAQGRYQSVNVEGERERAGAPALRACWVVSFAIPCSLPLRSRPLQYSPMGAPSPATLTKGQCFYLPRWLSSIDTGQTRVTGASLSPSFSLQR